jgi:hypothetical protein
LGFRKGFDGNEVTGARWSAGILACGSQASLPALELKDIPLPVKTIHENTRSGVGLMAFV